MAKPKMNDFIKDIKKMKLSDKIYRDADGLEFKLRDLPIDDEVEAESLIKSFGKNQVGVTNEDSKKLLSMVLTPVDARIKTFNPGRLDPMTAVEVLHDFLLRQKEKEFDLQNYSSTFTSELTKYIPNGKA